MIGRLWIGIAVASYFAIGYSRRRQQSLVYELGKIKLLTFITEGIGVNAPGSDKVFINPYQITSCSEYLAKLKKICEETRQYVKAPRVVKRQKLMEISEKERKK